MSPFPEYATKDKQGKGKVAVYFLARSFFTVGEIIVP